jgi:hypothetical protein
MMKLAYLSTICLIIVLFIAILICNQDGINVGYSIQNNSLNNDVYLININTVPTVIHKDDIFEINATLINKSHYPIKVWNNGCNGPLIAFFDKNIEYSSFEPKCPFLIKSTFNLAPGENNILIAGDILNPFSAHYKASSTGLTNATLKLEFQYENKSIYKEEFDKSKLNVVSCYMNTKKLSPCHIQFNILSNTS